MNTLLIYNLANSLGLSTIGIGTFTVELYTNWETVGNCPILQQIPTPLQLLTFEYFFLCMSIL